MKIIKLIPLIVVILVIAICRFNPGLITKGLQIYSQKAVEISTPVIKQVVSNSVKISEYSQFDNTNVKGSQINLAMQLFYKDGTIITVKTLGDSNSKNYTKSKPYNIKDPKNLSYINVLSQFKSTIIKDSKGNATEIKFIEVK